MAAFSYGLSTCQRSLAAINCLLVKTITDWKISALPQTGLGNQIETYQMIPICLTPAGQRA